LTKETTTAFPEPGDPQLDSDEFHRPHDLDNLLIGAVPLSSVGELLILELSDAGSDAFLEAIGA
jgi:hypothetical protein